MPATMLLLDIPRAIGRASPLPDVGGTAHILVQDRGVLEEDVIRKWDGANDAAGQMEESAASAAMAAGAGRMLQDLHLPLGPR